MAASFFWGLVAGSSLVIGGVLALLVPVHRRALGLVMAFGAGVLISAVAFELVEEAFVTGGGKGRVAFGLLVGSLVFFVGDLLIDRLGGGHRQHSGGRQAAGSAPAITLCSVLDASPHSPVLPL